MHFVRVLSKEYHVIRMSPTECVGVAINLVDSLGHIDGKMPKLLEQYE